MVQKAAYVIQDTQGQEMTALTSILVKTLKKVDVMKTHIVFMLVLEKPLVNACPTTLGMAASAHQWILVPQWITVNAQILPNASSLVLDRGNVNV